MNYILLEIDNQVVEYAMDDYLNKPELWDVPECDSIVYKAYQQNKAKIASTFSKDAVNARKLVKSLFTFGAV